MDVMSNYFDEGKIIAQKYNLNLTPELVYLIEALKVEGYWSLKFFTLTIQNKNLPFLEYIKSIIEGLGLNMSQRILIKIKPLQDFTKGEIYLECNHKTLNFHIEKSPFDGSKKIVTSLPYKRKYNLNLKIKNEIFPIIIKKTEEEMEVKSQLKGWAYYDLRFPTANLLRFLSEFVGDKKNLKIESFLFDASKEYVASAFSALIDAEGSIDFYGFHRRLRIRMRSKRYLEDWKKILNKFNIRSRLQKNNEKECELCAQGWETFDKLEKLGLKLYHSRKSKKWNKILNSYKKKQVPRNTAYQFYIQGLKEVDEPITARELAKKLDKSKRNVSHHLTLLMKKSLIKVDKSNMAYKYSSK